MVEDGAGEMKRLIRSMNSRTDDMLLFLTAFDGVLAEYERNPADARVPAARLERLKRLQRLPRVVVAVISGRSLGDLRERVPLEEGAFFVGLHGLEITGPHFALTLTDAIEAYGGQMADVAARMREVVAHVPGVRLEYKGPIVALHTREAAADDVVWSRFQLLSAAADLVNSGSVRTLRGEHVLELLPDVGPSRAEAVSTVEKCVAARYQRSVFTLYVGADWPDDDAAKIVGDDHVAAVVGRRTRSGYHLASPDQLDAIIEGLIAERTGFMPPPSQATQRGR